MAHSQKESGARAASLCAGQTLTVGADCLAADLWSVLNRLRCKKVHISVGAPCG